MKFLDWREPSLLAAGEFNFLGESGALSEIGWSDTRRNKLWRYNQHYFDDLNARGSDERRELHASLFIQWINDNTPGIGVAWEPYPSSLRIVNWLKWYLRGNELSLSCKHSLAIQVRWLSKRLEWHLLGNHLFVNAKALVFAGVSFDGREAEHWVNVGLRIIARELDEQVLPDGGNFERSPMYHAIFLEDLLDLINVAAAYPGKISQSTLNNWREVAARMLAWLAGMTHGDGEIGFFNDAAVGIAPSYATLCAYADQLSVHTDHISLAAKDRKGGGVTIFRESGYIRFAESNAVALLDVAPIGPDYLPGHAHADTLSFELSLFNQRVIVNGGTSCYGLGPERLRERGTAAHSTVEVDGENSSEVWSGFRVARRAYPLNLSIEQSNQTVTVACSHDGYRRLPGKPVHRRQWCWSMGSLIVRDLVDGKFNFAVARYILHPSVQLEKLEDRDWRFVLPCGNTVQVKVLVGIVQIEPAYYSQEFGRTRATNCLAVVLQDGVAEVALKWG